ncbi:MAG TPA: hypothetical protein VHX88_00245 [Solirubrobacteraceae bacterium]|nr:hypothetical protein [Solirubrobacteraceae bacterium]
MTDAPRRAVVSLEGEKAGGRWQPLGSVHLSRASFTLRWHPARAGLEEIRVVLRGAGGRTLAATATSRVIVGQPPHYCAAPVAPRMLPAGDGWIGGGEYLQGGPAPGLYQCQGSAYTVTVTAASGATVATQAVAAEQSFAIVLPAGTYTLTGGFCRGTATVTAGAETHANVNCPVS